MANKQKITKEKSAIDALAHANKIAFAPMVFQATVALRKLGVLKVIFNHRKKGGISIEGISESLNISNYGLSVLLEIAESSDIVSKDEDRNYFLSKTGYFLAYHETVNVNINFTQDVCYKGLFNLKESVTSGEPKGLDALGNWPTVYEGLSRLPENIQKSWFEFDHHYSDEIFDSALERVFKNTPSVIFDIGANTGKFTLKCLQYNNEVAIRLFDLAGQLKKAVANISKYGFEDRITTFKINWLKENQSISKGADVIWMSQFLDCFSKEEILTILKTCRASMNSKTELIIVETFTDRQEFNNAKFVLEATSLYFTAIANGNSKMYKATEFEELIDMAGLKIAEDLKLGEYHTMLVCKIR